MTARGRQVCTALTALTLLAGCDTTVSGAPAPSAPLPVEQPVSTPVPTTSSTTVAPTTTTSKPKPKPTTTTHRPPATTRTHAAPPPPPRHTTTHKPPASTKSVTYVITGSGDVSVRYLAGGTMHSASHIGLPWRKTVPLSGGRYAMDITTGSNANVDEQVSVNGFVVGSGHNEGAGTGSFSGSY